MCGCYVSNIGHQIFNLALIEQTDATLKHTSKLVLADSEYTDGGKENNVGINSEDSGSNTSLSHILPKLLLKER